MTAYETIIGLEVHAQLMTRTKMFCGCPTAFGAPPNHNVCPVCLALPGALPVPNRAAVDMAIRAGLGLHCTIRERSVFARKNYFYPDLSKGYQISQFDLPLCEGGYLDIQWQGEGDPEGELRTRRVGITRAHMEEDAAKNIHSGTGDTIVDFNRAGVPLLEIVSEPDMRSSAEAEAYLKALREILMFAGVNDGNLEQGSFRCDANVSLRPVGQKEFGTRTELKNINSFKFVRQAIEHEVARQEALLSSGGVVVQETRSWNEGSGKTISMRSKEEAHDYRYFPDPDLPPLHVTAEHVERIRSACPELPAAKRARWQERLGITAYDAQVLTSHPEVARFFEATVTRVGTAFGDEKKSAKKVANFIQGEVLRHLHTDGLRLHSPVSSEGLGDLLKLVADSTINGKIAKQVFTSMVDTGKAPKRIVDEHGLGQVTDTAAIETAIEEVLKAHPKEVQSYRGGKVNLMGFFVGQVMKATSGKANPKLVNQSLRALLEGN